MATYGYAGDFSSDDDEKIELIQERMVQNKYDQTVKPNKKQIEDTIESIKRLPFDQEINLGDDILAGLLDYYKTQRGPIVDSTRKLYHKIALRLIRGDQSSGGVPMDTTNGNSPPTNDNNNSINIISKGVPAQQNAADAYSSDEDDIEIVGSNNFAKKFDGRVAYNNNVDDDKMEVDSEVTHSAQVRNTKQVDLPTTDEEDDESSSESDDPSESNNDDELNSEPDMLEVTPIKAPPSIASREKEAVKVLMAIRPSTPKQTESSIRRQPLAQSTPKDSTALETAKKPYTRSQRVATRSATKSSRETSKVDNKDSSSTSAGAFLENKRASRVNYTLLSAALLVFVFAFLAYYFKSNIIGTAEPLFRKRITF